LFTTAKAPIPLTGVSVDAAISTLCARVSVTQRFVNQESHPIEAVYVFPLDEGAAVCGFEAVIDGTLVIGQVKEREEAFKTYDDAMERGDGAFLLDEERPDVFQASVGNLPPGKDVLLKLTYVTELTVEGDRLRFVIPTTVSPRYAPAQDRVAVGRSAADTLNPPVMWQVPYGLDLRIDLATRHTITRLESPSHPVAVSMNGERATVTLSQQDAALDRDFVLLAAAAEFNTPDVWIERDDDGREAVALAFVPKLPDTKAPAEVIFVADRSGSMGGSSIEQVRNALQLCLRSMGPGCYFNIIGFGSTMQMLFPESRRYDDSSLRAASDHVAAMQADLGGTEILPALQHALEQSRPSSLARQIVVLTDGEVTNTDAVLALAGQHKASARIFTFGIGAGASHHLVKGLARAGGGASEFIYPGERIESKVLRQFGRLLSPALLNVRIDWGTLPITQAPAAVPPVFGGGRLLVYGFLRDGTTNVTAATIRLTAEGQSGNVALAVPLDPDRRTSGRTVATLAARARIRELEEGPEWTSSRGSQQRERKAPMVSREIIELSIRYGLVSRETSFVAVEKRETPVLGDVQLRRVPIALTSGWGGLDWLAHNVTLGPALHPAMAAPGAAQLDCLSPPRPIPSAPASYSSGPRFPSFSWRPKRRTSTAAPPAPTGRASASPASGRHALIALQRADGRWELSKQFASALGRDLQQLETGLGAAGQSPSAKAAWATALALTWLETTASDSRDEWRLLAEKAREWLAAVPAVPPGGGTWLQSAERFLKALPSTV
jgi:Ca-activated chloride channel family protein